MGSRCSGGSTSCSGVRSQESGVGADFLTPRPGLEPPAQRSDQSTKHLGDGIARIQESALIVVSDVFQPSRYQDLRFDVAYRSHGDREAAQLLSGPQPSISL